MPDQPKKSRPIQPSNARRGMRQGQRRARTLVGRQLSEREIEEAHSILEHYRDQRPKYRRDCKYTSRPCPFVSCKYHLYLDITESGAIKLNFPDQEVWELKETCALDVADRGGITLEEVGDFFNLTRERIRQVESKALEKLSYILKDSKD